MKKLLTAILLLTGLGLSGQNYWIRNGENISYSSDNVGVGTNAQPNYRLAVEGIVRAREAHLNSDNWPDYVFDQQYPLPTLEDVQQHIATHGHLINIPSAEEVAQEGVTLLKMNKLLLEKVEELTRYILIHDQKRQELEKRIALLKKKRRKNNTSEAAITEHKD